MNRPVIRVIKSENGGNAYRLIRGFIETAPVYANGEIPKHASVEWCEVEKDLLSAEESIEVRDIERALKCRGNFMYVVRRIDSALYDEPQHYAWMDNQDQGFGLTFHSFVRETRDEAIDEMVNVIMPRSPFGR